MSNRYITEGINNDLRAGKRVLLVGPNRSYSRHTFRNVAEAAQDAIYEHPIHTLALVVLVGAVTGLRRWIAPRFRGLLSLLNATIVAQPALHLTGKWLGRSAEGSGLEWPAPAGVWHGLVPDGVTGTQLAANSAAVPITFSVSMALTAPNSCQGATIDVPVVVTIASGTGA